MSIGMFPLCKSQKYTNMYEFHERDLLPNCKVKKLAIGEHSNEETWTISHFLDWSLSFKDFVMCVMSKQAIVGNILIPSVVLILMKFSSLVTNWRRHCVLLSHNLGNTSPVWLYIKYLVETLYNASFIVLTVEMDLRVEDSLWSIVLL